jgi:hypothetical protein
MQRKARRLCESASLATIGRRSAILSWAPIPFAESASVTSRRSFCRHRQGRERMAQDPKFWQSAAVSVSKRRNSPRRAVKWRSGSASLSPEERAKIRLERLPADDPRQLQSDISKAGELFGWDPITILRPGSMKDHHLFRQASFPVYSTGARFAPHMGLTPVVVS